MESNRDLSMNVKRFILWFITGEWCTRAFLQPPAELAVIYRFHKLYWQIGQHPSIRVGVVVGYTIFCSSYIFIYKL